MQNRQLVHYDTAGQRVIIQPGDLTNVGGDVYAISPGGAVTSVADVPNTIPVRDADGGFEVGYLQIDTTPPVVETDGVGKIIWNDTDGTLEFGAKGGNVVIQIGQEEVVRVKNDSGGAYSGGEAVYISGSNGTNLLTNLANASTELASSSTIGIVTEPIASNNHGFVTTFGLVRNINTNHLVEGAAVWLSTVAGQTTSTRPSAPNHGVLLGFCLRKHAVNGVIFVRVDNGWELDELHNVLITGVAAGDVLVRNAGNTLWENKAQSTLSVGYATTAGSATPTAHASTHLYTGTDPTSDATITALAPIFWLDARKAVAGANTSIANRGTAGGNFTAPSTGPIKGTSTTGSDCLVFSSAATRLSVPSYTYGSAITVLVVEEMTADAFMASIDIGSGTANRFFFCRRNFYPVKNISAVAYGNVGSTSNIDSSVYSDLACFTSVFDQSVPASSELQLYINNLPGQGPLTSTSENTGTLGAKTATIGAYNDGLGSNYYRGNICQVLIFNRALSAAEMQRAYVALQDITGISNVDRQPRSYTANLTGYVSQFINAASGSNRNGVRVSTTDNSASSRILSLESGSTARMVVTAEGKAAMGGITVPVALFCNTDTNGNDVDGFGTILSSGFVWRGFGPGYVASYRNDDNANPNRNGLLIQIAQANAANRLIEFESGGARRLTMIGDGRLGIGTNATPTAMLHLPAGTAAANTAPLKLTSGTVLTAPEAGAIEFTTDDYYATITTGSARKPIVLADSALTVNQGAYATTNGRLTSNKRYQIYATGTTAGGAGTSVFLTAAALATSGDLRWIKLTVKAKGANVPPAKFARTIECFWGNGAGTLTQTGSDVLGTEFSSGNLVGATIVSAASGTNVVITCTDVTGVGATVTWELFGEYC